jgi:predicted acetyltransferase
MKVEVIAAAVKDKLLVLNLLQKYMLEMTSYTKVPRDESGSFYYKHFDNYWQHKSYFPFKILCNSILAGFLFVNDICYLVKNAHSIAEFYVVPEFRLSGVGRQAAHFIFRRFPGKWEVRQLALNLPAIRFWRSVINSITNENFTEITLNDERWNGPIQVFNIPGSK